MATITTFRRCFLSSLLLAAFVMLIASVQAASLVRFAGTGVAGDSGDGGPALEAKLNTPFGIVRGPDGAIWFCEYEGHVVRRIGKDGIISTVAGTGQQNYTGDGGPALKATLNNPHEIRFDGEGNLFIADTSNNAIRRIDAKTKIITTVAGTGKPGYSGDKGLATAAQLNQPISLQLNANGDLYICEIGNHVIRRVDAKSRLISTVAGTGSTGVPTDGAHISGTPLNGPRSLDVDARGNLWLATREGNQVLNLDLAAGLIHVVAGTGRKGFFGDGGQAKAAMINGPKGIVFGPDGIVYLADTENHVIRRINPKTGLIERLAGTGIRGLGAAGDPLTTQLSQPHALWLDADGSIFISDSMNHRILVLRNH